MTGPSIPKAFNLNENAKASELGILPVITSYSIHYTKLYDDRLGILVMDETRRMSSAMEDIEEGRQGVRTGRNHPSVGIWGIGNEEVFCPARPDMIRGIV